MARPAESVELGHNAVAVAIDKGKNSQQAVRWAIDHFLKGKNMQVVLIHVKTHNFNPQKLFLDYFGYIEMENSATGSAPSESEIDAIEVVLHDIDVPSALISYIEHNAVGNIVVGASNRNAITRRFKAADVPTSLEKSAPDFCAVYVICKGKVQSMRASNVCLMPSAGASTASSKSGANSDSSSAYWTTNSKSSFGNESITSGSSRSSMAASDRYYNSSPGNSNPRIPIGGESPAHHMYYNNSRTSDVGPFSNPKMHMGGEPPGQYPYSYRSSDSQTSSSNQSSYRFQGLAPLPTHPYSNTSSDYNSRNSYSSSNEGRSTPERIYPGQNLPYYGSNQNSFESASGASLEYNEHRSRTSSSSQTSFSDELEAEMTRVRAELKKTMDLYKSICEQASIAKQQADSLQNGEEEDMEEIKLAREAAIVVADLERLKCQAAMDAAQLSERLVDMEGHKRRIAEQKAARREEEEKKANKPSPVAYRVYTLQEIEVGTDYFSSSLKIGEGGYGPVYRAMLQHTPVAIKIDVLGRMRHPNMVLLVGACPEYGCLVYEYMENGSLEDRLFRKNNTRPIPWKTRFKIAAEIATALLFLHDAKPEPMVHRDLKPANILLDSNYTSKIADVGLARLVPPTVANQITQYHMTAAAGTFCYIDPEYQQTGKLSTKSDIYSLGVILLQILTARPPMALSYHVEEAIDAGTFEEILDPSISDWPFQEALALAQLALKCCELRKKDRPDLDSVVMPELVRLKELAISS
ncbi:U-box domain-containing protein 35 [Bienertia sinuspersici]